jgi:hypothetical protein
MIFKRILGYVIAFFVIMLVISCISIYQHRDLLFAYFTQSLSGMFGLGVNLFLYGFLIFLLIKAILSLFNVFK